MSSNSSKMESVGVKKRKKLRPNPNQHSLLKTKSLIRKKKNKSIKPRTNKPSQASQKHFSFHLPYGSEAMLNIQRVKVNQELLASRRRLTTLPSYRSSKKGTDAFTRKRKSSLHTILTTRNKRELQALERVAFKIKRFEGIGKRQPISNELSAVTHLKRGGVYITTSVGPIQFGMPPETIKDILTEGLVLPKYYIVPRERFNLNIGVSCAEIEFPMFFSFFVKGTVLTLITDRETETEIDKIVRESTIGPEEEYLFAKQEYTGINRHLIPDHLKEIEHFKVDKKMINYKFFDEKDLVTLEDENGGLIIINDDKSAVCFYIFDYKVFKTNQSCKELWNKFKDWDVYKLFIELKSKGYLYDLPECFHVISYDSAERIGNIYEEEEEEEDREGEVVPVGAAGADDFGYKAEDFRRATSMRATTAALIKEKQIKSAFNIPQFGITVLGNSHGFDQKGITTGFVIWVNGHGVMVDPPPHSTFVLQKYGILPRSISAIILTHCHADHDAGTFQKMLTDHKVDLITSNTIFQSFVRKYSAVSGLSQKFLKTLVRFRPVYLDEPNYWKGAVFNFFYSLHTIPCIGFKIEFQGKSLVYSSDTFYNKKSLEELHQKGVLSEGRLHGLINFPWDCDVVLHEAGVPPIHTPIESFMELSEKQRKHIYLIHIAGKEAAEAKLAQPGVQNTISLIDSPKPSTDGRMVKWMQIISNMEIFEKFSVNNALELLYMASVKRYKQGESIKSDNFLIIVSGSGIATAKKCVRALSEGDFFGELIFVKNRGAYEMKRSSSISLEDSFDGSETEEEDIEEALLEETFEAITNMTILELDFYAVKNLLIQDSHLQAKMEAIVSARRTNNGWTAIESNNILKKLRLSVKLELQGSLNKFHVNKGEIVSGSFSEKGVEIKSDWKKGKPVKFAILVDSGSISVETSSLTGSSDQDKLLLQPGMMIFEYFSFAEHTKHIHNFTLRAHEGEATVYAIQSEAFLNILQKSPHLMLAFFKTEVVF